MIGFIIQTRKGVNLMFDISGLLNKKVEFAKERGTVRTGEVVGAILIASADSLNLLVSCEDEIYMVPFEHPWSIKIVQ